MKFKNVIALSLSFLCLSLGVIACGGGGDDEGLVPVAGGGGAVGSGGPRASSSDEPGTDGSGEPFASEDGGGSDSGSVSDSDTDNEVSAAVLPSTEPTRREGNDTNRVGAIVVVLNGAGATSSPGLEAAPSIGVVAMPPIQREFIFGAYRGTGRISNDQARQSDTNPVVDRDANVLVQFFRNASNTETLVSIKAEPKNRLLPSPIINDLLFVSRDNEAKMVIWSEYPHFVDTSNLNRALPYAPIAIGKSPLRFTNRNENHSADCDSRHYRCSFKATNLIIHSFTGQYNDAEITGDIQYNPDHAEISLDIQTMSGRVSLERIHADGLRIVE